MKSPKKDEIVGCDLIVEKDEDIRIYSYLKSFCLYKNNDIAKIISQGTVHKTAKSSCYINKEWNDSAVSPAAYPLLQRSWSQ